MSMPTAGTPHADGLTATPGPVTTPRPVVVPPPGAPTILLVDDSNTQRRTFQRILQQAGTWHVVTATDGVDALEQIERLMPAVVLTDLFMPRMNGLALVEQVRIRFPQIPVVLITGRGSERTAVDALKAGAADYIPKRGFAKEAEAILERVLMNARIEMDKARLQSGMTGRVTRFSLDNDPRLVSPLVAQIREDLLAIGVCDRSEATRVGVALEEALLNAIYHGNLEVSSELRANGDESFHRLARERREQEPYRSRRVKVAARITAKRATFVIEDQGPGFEVAKLPDPTDPEYLDRPSGRGLLLMRAFMNEVRYNAAGNSVTLVKQRETKK
jgi:CheY-like chemotaxis protein/anti-sigma regulatory factor (Ser/Thr protein kinase)